YCVEHKAQNYGIGRTQSARLPADEVIVSTALLPRPDVVQYRHKQQRTGYGNRNHKDILADGHHGLQLWRSFRNVSSKFCLCSISSQSSILTSADEPSADRR